MPKLGESITEATITKWFKKEGDIIEEDDVLLEIAPNKVDSEIPSPVAGITHFQIFKFSNPRIIEWRNRLQFIFYSLCYIQLIDKGMQFIFTK